jgi:hypothetical protein
MDNSVLEYMETAEDLARFRASTHDHPHVPSGAFMRPHVQMHPMRRVVEELEGAPPALLCPVAPRVRAR